MILAKCVAGIWESVEFQKTINRMTLIYGIGPCSGRVPALQNINNNNNHDDEARNMYIGTSPLRASATATATHIHLDGRTAGASTVHGSWLNGGKLVKIKQWTLLRRPYRRMQSL